MKEFAPGGSKFFPLRVATMIKDKGGKCILYFVTSLNCKYFFLCTCVMRVLSASYDVIKMMATCQLGINISESAFSTSGLFKFSFNKTSVLACLFVLRFYGPVNPIGSCQARSLHVFSVITQRKENRDRRDHS